MAVYEYECPHCNKRFEKFYLLKDAVDYGKYARCPDCGKLAAKVISVVNHKIAIEG